MTILTYTQDDILKLRPAKIESKLLENMFKPLHEAGLSALLGASRAMTGSDDSAIASFRKSINSHDGQFGKPKNVFQHGRIRNSSGESSQSHSLPHAMATAPELHALPTLAAQKEEGFQRFYKAVVSPTHVRVTAGGRIVPNTKPPPSPTPKLAREREINLEAQHHARPIGLPHNTFYPNFPSSSFGPHPIYGFGPGVMALPFASPYGTAVPGAMPAPVHGPVPVNKQPAPGLSENTAQASAGNTSSGSESLANEQAEAFRFMPQGRWVNPWGPQFPYAMAGMMPGAGYMPAQFMGPNMAPPAAFYGMPTPQVQQTPIVPTRQRSNGSIHVPVSEDPTPAPPPAVSPALKAPLNPPISSIRPSQISRAHLESLRTNLRRVEDQLKYNVHQIDVPSMEQRASEIRDAIKGLEEALPSQLEFEELHYPKADVKGKSKSTSSSQPLLAPLGRKESRRIRSDSQKRLTGSRGSRSFRGTTSVRNSSAESDSAKMAMSSSTMAPTAPPFKPQGLDKFTSVSGSIEPVVVIDAADVDEPIKKTTTSTTTTRLPMPSSLSSASGSASASGSSVSMETLKKSTKPYLEGELLPGMDEKQAIKNGFHYRRPLTDEEIRARHLYWGRAPQSALRGLPKFDGKDFYFASPPKLRHSGRSAVVVSRGWGRRSSRGEEFAKKAMYSESVDNSEVSIDASTATSSDGTLIASCSTSQREKSEDSVFEVKRMPLSQKIGDEKQSPSKTSVRVSAPIELIQGSATGLSAPKCASPVQSSEPVHSADKSPDSKQATPTGFRDKLRRGTENLPPSGLGPHF